MKLKILTIYLILIIYPIQGRSQSFNSISKKISKYEFTTGLRKKKKDPFFEIRRKLISLNKLDFNSRSDTLYLLESYSIENGDFNGVVWNNSAKVNYQYNNDKFKFDVNINFIDYSCKLVQDWDTLSIRKEEKINSTMINPRNIYATRVIKSNGVLKIDCIIFKEFFLLERDR